MLQKDPKKTKWALSLLAVLVLTLVVLGLILSSGGSNKVVKFSDVGIPVEVVKTPEGLARGLSGRSGLAKDHGMLFVYQHDTQVGIWMKDMHFNIDVLWLDEQGTVVGMVEDMAPSSHPKVFTAQQPSRYVLELPSGFARQNSLGVGSRATLPKL